MGAVEYYFFYFIYFPLQTKLHGNPNHSQKSLNRSSVRCEVTIVRAAYFGRNINTPSYPKFRYNYGEMVKPRS